jgi:hypothetical protein
MNDRDLIAEPIHDTWRPDDGEATWSVYPSGTPSRENDRMAEIAESSLATLGGLARPWRIGFHSLVEGTGGYARTLTPGDSRAEVTADAVHALRGWSGSVVYFTADLDLFAYARTKTSRWTPKRVWLRLHSQLVLTAYGDEAPSGYLTFNHNLMLPESRKGDDNSELHDLNQPLLADALHQWESVVGPIEWEGNLMVWRYGYQRLHP